MGYCLVILPIPPSSNILWYLFLELPLVGTSEGLILEPKDLSRLWHMASVTLASHDCWESCSCYDKIFDPSHYVSLNNWHMRPCMVLQPMGWDLILLPYWSILPNLPSTLISWFQQDYSFRFPTFSMWSNPSLHYPLKFASTRHSVFTQSTNNGRNNSSSPLPTSRPYKKHLHSMALTTLTGLIMNIENSKLLNIHPSRA